MGSLDKRITRLEEALEKHLIESGEIRGDLKWLKRAVYFIVSSPFIIEGLHHLHAAAK